MTHTPVSDAELKELERLASFIERRGFFPTDQPHQRAAAVRAALAAIRAQTKVLEAAPVLSKYHGANGFEVEQFVADYERWRSSVRALSLTSKEPSNGR